MSSEKSMELEVGGPAAEAVEVAGPAVAERQGRALRQRKPVNYNVKSMESNGSNTPSWLKSTVSFTPKRFFGQFFFYRNMYIVLSTVSHSTCDFEEVA